MLLLTLGYGTSADIPTPQVGDFPASSYKKYLTIFQKQVIQAGPALIKTVAPGDEIFHHSFINLKTVSVQIGPNSGQGARR